MADEPYYIYVLHCADGSLYCGSTDNVMRRLHAHQTFKGAKYTRVKSRHPLQLIFHQRFDNKHDALSAEYHFKHQSRIKKLRYLRKHGVDIEGLQ